MTHDAPRTDVTATTPDSTAWPQPPRGATRRSPGSLLALGLALAGGTLHLPQTGAQELRPAGAPPVGEHALDAQDAHGADRCGNDDADDEGSREQLGIGRHHSPAATDTGRSTAVDSAALERLREGAQASLPSAANGAVTRPRRRASVPADAARRLRARPG